MPIRTYEIRVRGLIEEQDALQFADLDVVCQPPLTVLRGDVVDQAALHGLLQRVEGLGLELVEVRRVPDPS